MSVATETPATGIIGFLQRLYKPIYVWAMATFATKAEVEYYPVDITTLAPNSTFIKGAVVGINGVLYKATQATANLPCTLVTENGAFVVNTVNGKTAFVVSDPTPNADWEIFTDASIEYWVASVNSSISDIATIRSNATAAVKPTDIVSYNGTDYTVSQLLDAVARLMGETVVTQ